MTKVADKVIVALDVATRDRAMALVEQLRDQISFFKIGLQLYTAEGPEIVHAVRDTGANVFLDLKMHDIPNTVAKGVESACALGVQMLTIHLSGGPEMVRAAVAARKSGVQLLGITVLTSLTRQTLEETGIPENVENHVVRLARLGVQNGVDGVVASPREIRTLRAEFGSKILIVVPGIRRGGADANDQKRTMTPREALEAGANYLVIGRPITGDPNPREATQKIFDEIAK